MKNTFIIDRQRYDQMISYEWGGVRYITLQLLDFYIIEETDGSATFVKNRYNNQKKMTKAEFESFKARMYLNSNYGHSFNSKHGQPLVETESAFDDVLDSFR